jgi:hypothetical protein
MKVRSGAQPIYGCCDKRTSTPVALPSPNGAKSWELSVIAAATGKRVQFTDDTGHWRNLTVGRPAAIAFEEGVKGTHMAPGAK